MSSTCSICSGALPLGIQPETHTALCAQVVSLKAFALRAERDAQANAIEEAWGIIANAHGGNWAEATPEWRAAAERWRDKHMNPPDVPGGPMPTDPVPEAYLSELEHGAGVSGKTT